MSHRVATTALSIVGDALGDTLRWIANEVPNWAEGPSWEHAEADRATQRTVRLCTAFGVALLAAGTFKVWQYTREARRLVHARQDLAQDVRARPARVRQRREAIDLEGPVAGAAQAHRQVLAGWLAGENLALPAGAQRQYADLSQDQRDRFFALGSRVGYHEATPQIEGDTVEYDPAWHEDLQFMEQRYGGNALSQARACYDAGHRVGADAARQWMPTLTMSDRQSGSPA